MKSKYARTEVTDILLKNGYKPTIIKGVSDHFDVYTKAGNPRIEIDKMKKVFLRQELQVILPFKFLSKM